MELNGMKALMAASLLSGSVHIRTSGRDQIAVAPTDREIKIAVEVAQQIWNEVLKQERES